jgi:hypothetical protein
MRPSAEEALSAPYHSIVECPKCGSDVPVSDTACLTMILALAWALIVVKNQLGVLRGR